MAYRRIKYRTQACPNCGARILKVAEGDIVIDSPLVVCRECGQTSHINLRSEWCKHP